MHRKYTREFTHYIGLIVALALLILSLAWMAH